MIVVVTEGSARMILRKSCRRRPPSSSRSLLTSMMSWRRARDSLMTWTAILRRIEALCERWYHKWLGCPNMGTASFIFMLFYFACSYLWCFIWLSNSDRWLKNVVAQWKFSLFIIQSNRTRSFICLNFIYTIFGRIFILCFTIKIL